MNAIVGAVRLKENIHWPIRFDGIVITSHLECYFSVWVCRKVKPCCLHSSHSLIHIIKVIVLTCFPPIYVIRLQRVYAIPSRWMKEYLCRWYGIEFYDRGCVDLFSFNLRLMQRLVPGAKAQPEQHCCPPQTLGLEKTNSNNDTLIFLHFFFVSIQSAITEGECARPQTYCMTDWSGSKHCPSFRSL